MSYPEVQPIRAASRHLVRELKVLGGCGCIPGLSFSECHVLTELDRQGCLTASELADILVLEKSSVSRLVNGLRRQELIAIDDNAGDRRRRPLMLTETGRQRVAQLHAVADREVNSALDFIPPASRGRLAEAMDSYAKALGHARRCQDFHIRPIEPGDNAAVARIITEVMTEFGAVGCGYSIEDEEVQAMHEAYQDEGAAMFVVEAQSGERLGCGGIARLEGGEPGTCELRKMYFQPALRGTGMGTRLLLRCLDEARAFGYSRCYLETLESMHQARHLYRKLGFKDLEAPMGNTGHHACNRWMAMDL
jgi:putative acetyltransferase